MVNHEGEGYHTVWFVYEIQCEPLTIRQIKAQQKCADEYNW